VRRPASLWYHGSVAESHLAQVPQPPTEPELDPEDPKTRLQARLRTALLALPSYFEFNNYISGVNATDLFSLNTLLGASIESQVVKALNTERLLWDPDNDWIGCVFERQSQAFPDVRLIRKSDTGAPPTIVLGIELKGWFMLAKEGEPSFRMTQTPAACARHDLLAVIPWYLDNVLSGKPVAAEPFVVSSRWAAEYRNYYWQVIRNVHPGTDIGINAPAGAHPYPTKDEPIADVPAYDRGGNFGRVSRVPGLMSEWVAATNQLEVLGIRNDDWFRFLKLHTDRGDPETISAALERRLERQLDAQATMKAEEIVQLLARIASAFDRPD
jgi:hypothetical protein